MYHYNPQMTANVITILRQLKSRFATYEFYHLASDHYKLTHQGELSPIDQVDTALRSKHLHCI